MLREAARGKFTPIISLDGLIEAVFPHSLYRACKELCVRTMQKYALNTQMYTPFRLCIRLSY